MSSQKCSDLTNGHLHIGLQAVGEVNEHPGLALLPADDIQACCSHLLRSAAPSEVALDTKLVQPVC